MTGLWSLLLIAVCIQAVNGYSCTDTFIAAEDNNCYWLRVADGFTWATHKSYCEEHASDLVIIANNAQMLSLKAFILNFINVSSSYNVSYWIDLRCCTTQYCTSAGLPLNYHPGLTLQCPDILMNYIYSKIDFSGYTTYVNGEAYGSVCWFQAPMATVYSDTVCPMPSPSAVGQLWRAKNRCYYSMQVAKAAMFTQCRQQCRSLVEGDLADLSERDDYFNFKGLDEIQLVRIVGLHRSSTDNTLYFLNGTELPSGSQTYMGWLTGQPSPGLFCAFLQSGMDGFLSTPCQSPIYSICYKELPISPDFGYYCRPPYEIADDGNCYWIRNIVNVKNQQELGCAIGGGSLADVYTYQQYMALRSLLITKATYNALYYQNYFTGLTCSAGVVLDTNSAVVDTVSVIPWEVSIASCAPNAIVRGLTLLNVQVNFTAWYTADGASVPAGAICQFLPYPTSMSAENCVNVTGAFVWFYGGSCFAFFTAPKSWLAARRHCQQNGLGDLAVNLERLSANIPASLNLQYSWVGIHLGWKKDGQANTYYYADGRLWLNTTWHPSEPNGGTGESCVCVSNHEACHGPVCRFDDVHCPGAIPFTCERYSRGAQEQTTTTPSSDTSTGSDDSSATSSVSLATSSVSSATSSVSSATSSVSPTTSSVSSATSSVSSATSSVSSATSPVSSIIASYSSTTYDSSTAASSGVASTSLLGSSGSVTMSYNESTSGGNTSESSTLPTYQSDIENSVTPTEIMSSSLFAEYTLATEASKPKYKPLHEDPPPDPCLSYPCMNNASCVSEKDRFICDCPLRAVGYRCEYIATEICSDPSLCQRGAPCYLTTSNAIFCECAQGFSGEHCEQDVDECVSSPCMQGTCIDAVGFYKCACLDGYTGKQCEYELDECNSSPCRLNGTCSDKLADYKCDCIEGMTGKSCEANIDDCSANLCHNGAYCEDGLNNYTCHCPTYYSGAHCEQKAEFLVTIKMASQSFAGVAVVATAAMFAVIMVLDIIKLCCNNQQAVRSKAKAARRKRPKF